MSIQPMTDESEEPNLNSAMEVKNELPSHMDTEDGSYAVIVSHNSDSAISPACNTTFSIDNHCFHDVGVKSNESELDAPFPTSQRPLSPSRDLTSAMPSCDVSFNHRTFKQSTASTFELRPMTTFSSGQPLPTHKVIPTPTSHESQPSFAESYTSLTSWTTKLMAQGIGQSPLLSNESQPIPLVGANYQPSIPASSAPFYFKPDPVKANFTPPYSKIGPITPDPEVVPADMSYVDLSAGSSSVRASPVLKSKQKSTLNKEHRFKKTADALHKSGLWEVAMKTGNLIKRNRELQKELEQFRADALLFLKSVIKNPQNRDFIKNVLSNALSSGGTHQKKASVMSIVVSAAATVSVKMRTSPSTVDSGISCSSSCGSQSDHSVSNFLKTNSHSSSPEQSGQRLQDAE